MLIEELLLSAVGKSGNVVRIGSFALNEFPAMVRVFSPNRSLLNTVATSRSGHLPQLKNKWNLFSGKDGYGNEGLPCES